MRVSIIFSNGGIPVKVYLDNDKAVSEYKRLRDLDDCVKYSLIELGVEDSENGIDN